MNSEIQRIREALQDEYRTSTYLEMGRRSGVSASYVRSLVVGRRDIRQMTLDILLKLFPKTKLDLGTDKRDGVNVVNNSAPFAINQSSVNINITKDEIKGKIINSLIDLEIQPDVLALVLKTVKNTEV